jgi:predicted ATPase
MKRTIADARQALEQDVAPGLNDHRMRELQAVVKAEEDKARARAASYVEQREGEVRAIRDEALRLLTEARDRMEELTSAARLGRVPAQEVAGQLQEARRQQQQAEAELARAEAIVARIESVEDDPVAFVDDLFRRNPQLMPEWPW